MVDFFLSKLSGCCFTLFLIINVVEEKSEISLFFTINLFFFLALMFNFFLEMRHC